MSQVQSVNGSNFESEVLQSDVPVVVDFYADWCPPCRRLAPILDRLAKDYAGQVKIVKVNSDHEPVLAERYNVTGLPTLVFFENGQHAGQFTGLPPEESLRDELDRWAGSRN